MKFAINQNEQVVLANDASPLEQYFCSTCKKPVKLRGGKFKSLYFVHEVFQKSNNKGETSRHLQGKSRIKTFFRNKNIKVVDEIYFKSIKRRADLMVEFSSSKVLVEYQCSPINLKEIRQRKADYTSLNFKSVWIAGPKHVGKNLFSTIQKFGKYSKRLGIYFIYWDALKEQRPTILFNIKRQVLGRVQYNKGDIKLIFVSQGNLLENNKKERTNMEWELQKITKAILGNARDDRYVKVQERCYINHKNLLGCPWIVHFPRTCTDFKNKNVPLLNRVLFLINAENQAYITLENFQNIDHEFWQFLCKNSLVLKTQNGWKLEKQKIIWYKDTDEKLRDQKRIENFNFQS